VRALGAGPALSHHHSYRLGKGTHEAVVLNEDEDDEEDEDDGRPPHHDVPYHAQYARPQAPPAGGSLYWGQTHRT
jgi:hypothetical protein